MLGSTCSRQPAGSSSGVAVLLWFPTSAPTATAPAAAPAAPAAAAPPSSEAQQLALREQLADMKAMFEQGLIPSREIYEDKVRQILGLE